MPSSLEFLAHLTSIGASVSLDGDDLVLSAPKDVITSEIRSELLSRKAELLLLLKSVKPRQPLSAHSRSDGTSLLSHAQQRVWFLSQLEPGNAVWNVATILHICGRLDEHALSRALSEIVSRHGVLRSTFLSIDGVPHFSMHPPPPETMRIVRFSSAEAALEKAHAAAVEPFDLAVETFRAFLCAAPSGESFLTVAAHHIACDGWSLGILAGELSSLYHSYSRGVLSRLPALSFQYSDYVAWEGETSATASEADLDWWKARLAAPLPVLQLPTDHPRSSHIETAGRRMTASLPQTITGQLHEFARKHEVTPFMLLLAVFKILLFRYTGLEDILVGTVSSHRKRREFEPIIGMFANPVVLRTDLSGNPSFHGLLARVRDTVTSSFSHDTLPFDRLVEYLHPTRQANDSPLFQVSFTYQNLPISKLEWDGVNIVPQPANIPGARYDISVEVWETESGLSCDFEYRTRIFDAGTIERMQKNYRQLIEGILADCDTPIERLAILPGDEHLRLAAASKGSYEDYPELPIHALFEQRCMEFPDAVALIEGTATITYKELSSAADRIADELVSRGVKAGDPVAVLMSRSVHSVMAMLGILKAGGFYVPLDGSTPQPRLVQSLGEAQTKYILVNSTPTSEWLLRRSEFVCLDVKSVLKGPDTRRSHKASRSVLPADLMCVLYTSGSTGVPKGIEILHRGVVRLLFSNELASFGKRERVLHMAPEAFDASLLEIWAPLVHGGTCVIDSELHPSVGGIARHLEAHSITTAWLTASLFNWIVTEEPKTLAPLRKLYVGGEVLSVRHVRLAQEALPHVQIFNGYGPTEATIFTCVYPVPSILPADLDSIPIGRPISNTEVYLLDAHKQLVPVGVPGELYIGGDALARGYRNQPGLTANSFVVNSITGIGVLYRSGDLAAWLPDGNLRFIGRIDDQIKIRGHRVELSEVEAAIAQCPGVISNAVLVKKSLDSGDRIVAWFSADRALQPEELRTVLVQQLPSYMVPSLLIPLHSMPLLHNGKINRAALAQLSISEKADRAAIKPFEEGDLVYLIAQAMADLLGLQMVRPTDDFFLLGGHSLLALQLASRIEALLGQKVSAALLFRATTPKTIAVLLEDGHVLRPQAMVPLRSAGTLPMVFCVHLLTDGTIQQYLSLVRSLDPEVPVYALCPVDFGLHPGGNISLQQIAAAHILQIRRVRPKGGYYLCGYSSGGILAFEIAQQLRREGELVTLILIDSFPPRILRRMMSREPGAVLRLLAQPLAWKRIRNRVIRRDMKPKMNKAEDSLAELLRNAMRRYKPYPYPGKVILFQSRDSEQIGLFNLDGFNNWGQFISREIEVRSVPGNHLQIMKPPFVSVLAEEMLKVLSSPSPEIKHSGTSYQAQ